MLVVHAGDESQFGGDLCGEPKHVPECGHLSFDPVILSSSQRRVRSLAAECESKTAGS